ncbi:MAG: hypothetical protein CEN90_22 [Parcubacteria group bacterium Licking1014_17]|nr:MAG: hypothetical protein CEN90_22 [Parcubacteria group bacterium Licking1014_17]
MKTKIKNRIFVLAVGLVLFAAAQLAGVWAAQKLSLSEKIGSVPSVGDMSFSDLIVLILVAAVFIWFGIRFRNYGGWMFRIVMTIAVISGLYAVAQLFLPVLPAFILSLVLAAVYWILRNVFAHDLIMLFVFIGIGASLSLSFTPLLAAAVLLVFSIYDIISVYGTKHMVAMADAMIESRAIFGFVIPFKLVGFKDNINKVYSGGEHMMLGSGDVLLPILLSGSLIRVSLSSAVIVALASVGGFILMHLLFLTQEKRKPMAALPPIAAAAIIGYLAASILNF